jgi:hypothetical protein
MTTDNDAATRKAARREATRDPDIRMRSNGAAETRALMYCTPKGEAFVRTFAAKTPGFWREEESTYFFHETLLPVDELNASGLKLVAGIGTTAEHDMPWYYGPSQGW